MQRGDAVFDVTVIPESFRRFARQFFSAPLGADREGELLFRRNDLSNPFESQIQKRAGVALLCIVSEIEQRGPQAAQKHLLDGGKSLLEGFK